MEKMSICKFMLLYHGKPLTAGAKYSHELLKKEFNLKTCPSDYVSKNEELVATGQIVYVEDSYGEILAYPVLSGIFTCDEECDYIELEDGRVTKDEIEEVKELLRCLSDLPPDKLQEILIRFKGIDSICRRVINEKRRRNISKPKKYKKQKLLCQAKGMENPEKYERRIEIVYKKMR